MGSVKGSPQYSIHACASIPTFRLRTPIRNSDGRSFRLSSHICVSASGRQDMEIGRQRDATCVNRAISRTSGRAAQSPGRTGRAICATPNSTRVFCSPSKRTHTVIAGKTNKARARAFLCGAANEPSFFSLLRLADIDQAGFGQFVDECAEIRFEHIGIDFVLVEQLFIGGSDRVGIGQ